MKQRDGKYRYRGYKIYRSEISGWWVIEPTEPTIYAATLREARAWVDSRQKSPVYTMRPLFPLKQG